MIYKYDVCYVIMLFYITIIFFMNNVVIKILVHA